MRRKVPTRIKVMGQPYAVRVVQGLEVAIGEALGNDEHVEHLGVLGVCDPDAQIIAIEEHQGPDRQQETFLHESLHAMLALGGFRDTLGQEVEESVTKRLAPILMQYLRDNPAVYTFLTGRETTR